MKTGTKYLIYGGAATMLLGPSLVASLAVSLGAGVGQFAGITIQDALPSLVDGFQDYEGGTSEPLFGDDGAETSPQS